MKTIEFSWETRENPRNSQKSIENPEKKNAYKDYKGAKIYYRIESNNFFMITLKKNSTKSAIFSKIQQNAKKNTTKMPKKNTINPKNNIEGQVMIICISSLDTERKYI
jgi:hypothetical protein